MTNMGVSGARSTSRSTPTWPSSGFAPPDDPEQVPRRARRRPEAARLLAKGSRRRARGAHQLQYAAAVLPSERGSHRPGQPGDRQRDRRRELGGTPGAAVERHLAGRDARDPIGSNITFQLGQANLMFDPNPTAGGCAGQRAPPPDRRAYRRRRGRACVARIRPRRRCSVFLPGCFKHPRWTGRATPRCL